jgi:hypothetical protein
MFKPGIHTSFQPSQDAIQMLRQLFFRNSVIELALKLVRSIRKARKRYMDSIYAGFERFQTGRSRGGDEDAQTAQQSETGAHYDQCRFPGCFQGPRQQAQLYELPHGVS